MQPNESTGSLRMSGVCIDCGAITKGHGKRCYGCASKKRWSNQAFKKKTSGAIRLALANPEIKKRQSNAIILACSNPEVKKRMSNASKKRWSDSVMRQKHSNSLKIAHARGDFDIYDNPEIRHRMSETVKKSWADHPELKEEHSNAMKAAHARGAYGPKIRQKMSDGIKDAWARGAYDNRALIGNPSKLEIKVLEALKSAGLDCDDQYSPENCRYAYDLYIPEYRALVEVDGTYWHGLSGREERDSRKDEWAISNGYSIIRIPEDVINEEGMDYIVEQVIIILEEL